jgi:hypothetical protein
VGIDWSLFTFKDPALLKAVIQRQVCETNQIIPKVQLAEPSHLQNLVKVSRRAIIDPVLTECALHSDPEPESEEEVDPEVIHRQREHQKIRDLKQRTVHSCGLTISLQSQAAGAVFIRHDLEDESGEVNIAADEEFSKAPTRLNLLPPPARSSSPMSPPAWSCKAVPKKKLILPTKEKTSARKTGLSSPIHDNTPPQLPGTKPLRGNAKQRPETYKLAWTDSEQNLLERLLEEIPDGEKNRWAKISRAMNGRRTPKQVASRVQKYFEKLKRFGVG